MLPLPAFKRLVGWIIIKVHHVTNLGKEVDMPKGCFITIEGVEGAGKSTNIELIERLLEAQCINHITTREPGGTLLSEKIRALVLDKDDTNMTAMAELLLVFAARTQHVQELILPKLEPLATRPK